MHPAGVVVSICSDRLTKRGAQLIVISNKMTFQEVARHPVFASALCEFLHL